MGEKLQTKSIQGFLAELAGTTVGIAADAASIKGVLKYVAIYAGIHTATVLGQTITDEGIMDAADSVPYHMGHGFGVFAEHMNHISVEQVVLELAATLAAGWFIKNHVATRITALAK